VIAPRAVSEKVDVLVLVPLLVVLPVAPTA
jgi:hypothetical protein